MHIRKRSNKDKDRNKRLDPTIIAALLPVHWWSDGSLQSHHRLQQQNRYQLVDFFIPTDGDHTILVRNGANEQAD